MGWIHCDGCRDLLRTDREDCYDARADKHWCFECFPDYDDPRQTVGKPHVDAYINHSQGR